MGVVLVLVLVAVLGVAVWWGWIRTSAADGVEHLSAAAAYVAGMAERHPRFTLVVVALFLVGLWVSGGRGGGTGSTDPTRSYAPGMRREAFDRAGNRCEYDGWLPVLRCRRPAQECDHFWPWSRGGATSLPNAVAACRMHNQSKRARMPSPAQRRRIARRRRRYFAPGSSCRPGHWFGLPAPR